MKNKFLKIISLVAFVFLFGLIDVNAATGSTTVSATSSKILVGNNVTVTVKVSSSSAIGSWDCTLSYDTTKLAFVSSTASGQRMVGYGDGSKKSATYTFTFKAKASGTANVRISSASILDWTTEQELNPSKGSTSINIITQAQLEASYSSNNNLSSLSVENASLTPAFDAGTTTYSVELEPNTTSIIVGASAADSKASVAGAGIINVVDGNNVINIVVTAENGKTKTYTINATVKELAPIEVKVDGKTYNVVRKEGVYQAPTSFEKTSIKIGEEEVLAYNNKKIATTIVGLKDETGNVGLYIYDSKTKEYSQYKSITIGSTNLYLKKLTDKKDVPIGYESTSIKIDDITFDAWNYGDNKNFYLVYGANTETGEQTFYLYNKEESSIQRFYNDQVKDLSAKLNEQQMILIIVGAIAGIFFVTTIILFIKRKGKKRNRKPTLVRDDFLERENEINEELKSDKKGKKHNEED